MKVRVSSFVQEEEIVNDVGVYMILVHINFARQFMYCSVLIFFPPLPFFAAGAANNFVLMVMNQRLMAHYFCTVICVSLNYLLVLVCAPVY